MPTMYVNFQQRLLTYTMSKISRYGLLFNQYERRPWFYLLAIWLQKHVSRRELCAGTLSVWNAVAHWVLNNLKNGELRLTLVIRETL